MYLCILGKNESFTGYIERPYYCMGVETTYKAKRTLGISFFLQSTHMDLFYMEF